MKSPEIIDFLMINYDIFLKLVVLLGFMMYMLLNLYYYILKIVHKGEIPKDIKESELLDDDFCEDKS